MNKDIHIVFGESARGMFIRSKKFDLDSIQLISLNDCLNLGPICDLDSVEEIEQRSNWLSKIFEDETFGITKGDIETLKILIDFIARDKYGDWNSPEMVLKAAQFAEKQREHCLMNSIENGLTELLFRANEGKLIKQYAPMHEWAKLIYENTI